MKLKIKTEGLEGDALVFAEALNKTLAQMPEGIDKEAVSELITESLKGLPTTEKFDEAIAELKAMLATQGATINELSEKAGKPEAPKTLGGAIVASLKAAIAERPGNKLSKNDLSKGVVFDLADVFNVKAPATMTRANVTPVGTNAIPFSLAEYESGLTRVVRARPFIMSLANVRNIGTQYAQWAEQANPDGAADWTAEAATKKQVDFDWVEKSAKVEKVTAYIKVSTEALEDLDGLEDEINTELLELIRLKMDEGIYKGSGVSPIVNGLLNQDTAWAAGAFALAVQAPNNFDVLKTAVTQVLNANFYPTEIVMHPTDVAKMELTKDTANQYVLPPFTTSNGQVISGIPIVASTLADIGNFTVGDFTKLNVRLRKDASIKVGHDGNDFLNNLVTILCEARLAVYVKSNHQAAFVTGTFSTAKTALTAA